MSVIKANDLVKVVADNGYNGFRYNPYQIGRVLRTYDVADGVAIVEFSSGMIVKIPFDRLFKIEVEPRENEEVKVEIPEGAKLITAVDYDNAVFESVSDFTETVGDYMGGMAAASLGTEIGEKLFESQDSVVMTKDEFIVTLWDACSPVNVSKSTNGEMSLDESLMVSITGIIALLNVADILFDDESENA